MQIVINDDTIEAPSKWCVSFNNIIPDVRAYFLYVKNTSEANISVPRLYLSSSVAGVIDSTVYIDYVQETEEIFFKNSNKLMPKPRLLDPVNTLDVEVTAAQSITGLDVIYQLTRYDLGERFKTYSIDLDNLIMPPGAAIGFRWNLDMGNLSGSLVIEE